MAQKMCVLEENKICDECGQCLYCDLDPQKLCDNCCKCIEEDLQEDYKTIEISEIIPYGPIESESAPKDQDADANTKPYKRYRFRIVRNDT